MPTAACSLSEGFSGTPRARSLIFVQAALAEPPPAVRMERKGDAPSCLSFA